MSCRAMRSGNSSWHGMQRADSGGSMPEADAADSAPAARVSSRMMGGCAAHGSATPALLVVDRSWVLLGAVPRPVGFRV